MLSELRAEEQEVRLLGSLQIALYEQQKKNEQVLVLSQELLSLSQKVQSTQKDLQLMTKKFQFAKILISKAPYNRIAYLNQTNAQLQKLLKDMNQQFIKKSAELEVFQQYKKQNQILNANADELQIKIRECQNVLSRTDMKVGLLKGEKGMYDVSDEQEMERLARIAQECQKAIAE